VRGRSLLLRLLLKDGLFKDFLLAHYDIVVYIGLIIVDKVHRLVTEL